MQSQYDIQNYTYQDLEDKIVLPIFQRKLVWSKNEKNAFIETLHNGYPFGAILIYKYEGESKISLIDGLQRFTTIRDYYKHPENYIDFSDYSEKIIDSLYEKDEIASNARDNLNDKIKSSIRDYMIFISENSTRFNKFFECISQNVSMYNKDLTKVYPKLNDLHEDMLEHINNYLDVKNIKIPTIEFKGSVSDLATVFENLNRGGQKLSKYQVFAAQWSTYILKLSEKPNNLKILGLIIDRYKNLTKTREIEIENFNEIEMNEKREINLSEFCYAYGKIIIENMSVFWDIDNEDLANQVGYSTLAIVLNISNKQLNTIVTAFNEINSSEFIENLIEKTIEVYKDINVIFKKPFSIPGVKEDQFIGGSVGTDFQILSFFASLWNTKYGNVKLNLSFSPIPRWRNDYNRIEKNLLKYFILDTVSSKWSGSGDTKLDTFVLDNQIIYKYDVDRNRLESSLLNWNDDVIQKSSINFDKTSKLLYTILCSFYSDKFKENKYDCEHIVPRYYLNKIKEANIPGGSLGNLMYLDTNNNRSKKELTLYDQLKPGQKLDKDFFEFQMYPSKESFEEIRKEIESTSKDYSNLISTIKNRGQYLINDLINKLYL